MSKVVAHAPAKINLVLEVEPRKAGEEKHRLSSVFCTTSLTDTLMFDFVSSPEPFAAKIAIESVDFDASAISLEDNTLTKTVEQFKRVYGSALLPSGTLEVHLFKSIPAEAGLGGGSSDAAALLRMLCWLAQVEPLSEPSLSVARAVGADVPFFLYAPKAGFCAHMGGYGDEFLSELPKPQLSVVLIKPQNGVATKEAYATFDAQGTVAKSTLASEKLAAALKAKEGLKELAALFCNNLEPAAMKLVPQLRELKERIASFSGVLGVTMCGSGSTLFALCVDADAAQICMEHFSGEGLWAVAVQT